MMLILSRINPTGIVVGHLKTLHDARRGKISVIEIVVFGVILLCFGSGIYVVNPTLKPQVFSSLLNFYAIIGGFLISALFIIVSYGEVLGQNRRSLPEAELARYKKLHIELFSNASFGVLVAFFGSSICVLATFVDLSRVLVSISGITILIFLHTLLMVLKRLDSLFRGSL